MNIMTPEEVAKTIGQLSRAARKWRKIARLRSKNFVAECLDAQELGHIRVEARNECVSLQRTALARRAALADRLAQRMRRALSLPPHNRALADWTAYASEAREILGDPNQISALESRLSRANRRATTTVQPTRALYAPILGALPISPPTAPLGRPWLHFAPDESYAPGELLTLADVEQGDDVHTALTAPWSRLPRSEPLEGAHSTLRAASTPQELAVAAAFDEEKARESALRAKRWRDRDENGDPL
jgi:hypothetical protein